MDKQTNITFKIQVESVILLKVLAYFAENLIPKLTSFGCWAYLEAFASNDFQSFATSLILRNKL